MGIPDLLQHTVGVVTALCHLCRVCRYSGCLQGQGCDHENQENQISLSRGDGPSQTRPFRAVDFHLGGIVLPLLDISTTMADIQGAICLALPVYTVYQRYMRWESSLQVIYNVRSF